MISAESKQCCHCSRHLELDNFHKNRSLPDGLHRECKECRSELDPTIRSKRWTSWYQKNKARLLQKQRDWRQENPGLAKDKDKRAWERLRYRKYGISVEMFNQLCSTQEYSCAICNVPFSSLNKAPHVDHDHSSGLVRGLLCGRCNFALGGFRDSQEILQAALEYLQNPPTGDFL